jgi:murein DD-endopeptidase MepM/ murein hydrolase activator NlpD
MDALALKYVRDDALKRVYPHPLGALSEVCQGLHPTAGLYGNWAIDFCAPGGTKVLAVENATITKLSGRDPASGANQTIGIFGWSIHYETPEGYRYFSTHYGSRSPLQVGQHVDAGQVVGTVGHWPGDESRSHTHLGVTSPLGTADAKKRITDISTATKIAA